MYSLCGARVQLVWSTCAACVEHMCSLHVCSLCGARTQPVEQPVWSMCAACVEHARSLCGAACMEHVYSLCEARVQLAQETKVSCFDLGPVLELVM